MKKQKVKRVAVLVDISSGWGRRVVKGVANYAYKAKGWQLSVEERGMNEKMYLKEGWNGHGVIARVSEKGLAEELKERGLPVVNVSSLLLEGVDLPKIKTDEKEVAKMAVKHFRDRGFQSLAYFGLYGGKIASYAKRRGELFAECAGEQGISCEIFRAKRGTSASWEVKRREIGTWLEGLAKPVGVLTWDAVRGRQVLSVCLEGGLAVPEEVAVLAAEDDELLSEACYPAMSGIVTAAEQIGHEAGRLLDDLMNGRKIKKEPTLFSPDSIKTRMSTDILAIDDKLLRRAIEYIRNHVHEPIQVTDIADELSISRRSLERRFVRFLGHTPAKEIQDHRLNIAKRLLRETELSILEIAQMSGYCSNEYMIRVFKKSVGQTPLKYRQWLRGNSSLS